MSSCWFRVIVFGSIDTTIIDTGMGIEDRR